MENLSYKEIIQKTEEIVQLVKDSPQYQDYLLLEDKMKNHSRIPQLISNIKILQKKLVRLEVMGKSDEKVDSEITKLINQLEEIPLYLDFISAQIDLNESFQSIKQTIEEMFKF